ncbi:MAG TPA: (2Fe-2S) ferredoxin domain-containing protein [Isosphaeraceae bacterium]
MSQTTEDPAPAPATRVKSRVQVLLCKGCCCGRTDRGLPAVPVERIKAAWKAEKLNRAVQLTISGCLGPCDLPNVAVVVSASGTTWFGRLDGDGHYDALIAWARAGLAEGAVGAEPEGWAELRFERFPPPG